ncbi:MAG TPA: alpha/beta fold hydrolase [Polyangiaceae bacterium]|nr:alpha/beta fold hydrolase [Polyangiaceae bacterium]
MSTQRIDSLESFDIDGMVQWVLLRGDLHARRVLLIVQQGPGFPLIQEARALEGRLHLEADAVVAYWDQRGTGRSWDADSETINLVQLVTDVRAMVDALCARLQVDRVDILGLSIGGTLATLAAGRNPARIGHIVAVGIDVDWGESERYAYTFACDEAARRGDRRARKQLEAIGAPPHDTSKKFLTRVRWVTAYGGIHRSRGFLGLLWDTVWRLLVSRHYSVRAGQDYVPSKVEGLLGTAQSISVSGWSACAVVSGGDMLCWGDNRFGQLGNNTIAPSCCASQGCATSLLAACRSPVPTQVEGLTSGVTSASAGGCAVTAGEIECWGQNPDGQLGNNTDTSSLVPVPVVGFP